MEMAAATPIGTVTAVTSTASEHAIQTECSRGEFVTAST